MTATPSSSDNEDYESEPDWGIDDERNLMALSDPHYMFPLTGLSSPNDNDQIYYSSRWYISKLRKPYQRGVAQSVSVV